MENRKMEVICSLMEELQEMMEPNESDFSERLGREKPKVEIEMTAMGEPGMEEDGEMMAMGDDMEMEDESPDAKLKSRLMKMRGA